MAVNLKTFNLRPYVPKLFGTTVLHVSAYIQKLPTVIGDDVSKSDAHLAKAPTRLTIVGVNPETKQASLILMFSYIGKLGHWALQNIEALYSLTSVTQLVDLVGSNFVIKDC